MMMQESGKTIHKKLDDIYNLMAQQQKGLVTGVDRLTDNVLNFKRRKKDIISSMRQGGTSRNGLDYKRAKSAISRPMCKPPGQADNYGSRDAIPDVLARYPCKCNKRLSKPDPEKEYNREMKNGIRLANSRLNEKFKNIVKDECNMR